ncbi:universal stress protein [Congregibacter variabilis]|uniref:Universal stress protein n=1 Tax=Congregibacter variabilis TaxID=3081200 RepID=A0ABZ0I1U6_9GAMM|nr:universal stress protein [Congregibacter sp. IMCC43200]
MELVADRVGLGELPKVLICADKPRSAAKILPHAKALAAALDADLTLLHIMEAHNSTFVPADPVEWECSRREAEAFVGALASAHSSPDRSISTRVLQGCPSDQIATCVSNGLDDVVVLCRSTADTPGLLGQTVRNVVDKVDSSVLVIPPDTVNAKKPPYRRVLLPLDGSPRAEVAISIAAKIARDQGADIVLVHAVPQPDLIAVVPLETEDIELRDRLQRRNERVAQNYLERQCEQIRGLGVAARPLVLVDGDVRRQLKGAIASESADLVVISSYGNGGHADVSAGDMAIFLLANASAPVLMVRQARGVRGGHVHAPAQSNGVRQPTGAS